PASMIPAFTSSSLYLPIAASSSGFGSAPDSDSFVALTITITFMAISFPYRGFSQLTIHGIPYLSVNIPNFCAQNVSLSGIVIFPPAESPAYTRSASAGVFTLTFTEKPAGFSNLSGGQSDAIRTWSPIRIVACMIFFPKPAGVDPAAGDPSKGSIASIFPPSTFAYSANASSHFPSYSRYVLSIGLSFPDHRKQILTPQDESRPQQNSEHHGEHDLERAVAGEDVRRHRPAQVSRQQHRAQREDHRLRVAELRRRLDHERRLHELHPRVHQQEQRRQTAHDPTRPPAGRR